MALRGETCIFNDLPSVTLWTIMVSESCLLAMFMPCSHSTKPSRLGYIEHLSPMARAGSEIKYRNVFMTSLQYTLLTIHALQ